MEDQIVSPKFPATKIGIVAGISAALTFVALGIVFVVGRFLFDLFIYPK